MGVSYSFRSSHVVISLTILIAFGLAIFDDQMLVEDYPEPEPASGSIGIGYEGG